jgi:hypothetical protein
MLTGAGTFLGDTADRPIQASPTFHNFAIGKGAAREVGCLGG